METFLEEVERTWKEEQRRERILHSKAPMCLVRFQVSSVRTDNLGFPDSLLMNGGN